MTPTARNLFIAMIWKMDMSYFDKPVLIKAILRYADEKDFVRLEDIRVHYERR